jgi:hypothetical protein
MDVEFLIIFGFMVVKSGCFKTNKKIVFIFKVENI